MPGPEGNRGVQMMVVGLLQMGDFSFHGRCKNSVTMKIVKKT